MDLVTWSPRFATSIPAIDRQHMQLFEAINELNLAIEHGEGAERVEEILRFLSGYTRRHFEAEESLMQRHGYPDSLSHQADHERLKSRLADHVHAYRGGNRALAPELVRFIGAWICDHVLHKDLAYSEYFREQGLLAS